MSVRWVGRSLWDGAEHPLDDRNTGCPHAAAAGVGAPVVPTRVGPPPRRPAPLPPPGLGAMWRWADLLVPAGAGVVQNVPSQFLCTRAWGLAVP